MAGNAKRAFNLQAHFPRRAICARLNLVDGPPRKANPRRQFLLGYAVICPKAFQWVHCHVCQLAYYQPFRQAESWQNGCFFLVT